MSRRRENRDVADARVSGASHGSPDLSPRWPFAVPLRKFAIPIVFAAAGLLSAAIYWRYVAEKVTDYDSEADHFKYGSIGSDDAEGVPQAVWEALPELFADYLPNPKAFRSLPAKSRTYLDGYRQFGFVIEDGKSLPVGFSQRRVAIPRIGMNCAVCHTSTVKITDGMQPDKIYGPGKAGPRLGPAKDRVAILGMPAQTLDIQSYIEFLVKCAADSRFTAANFAAYIDRNPSVGAIDKLIHRLAIPTVRAGLLRRAEEFAFFEKAPRFGPGRIDTFNPYKRLQFRFPYDDTIGTADFPTLWNQGSRAGLHIHWDGNNDSVLERNITAALGAGARPVSLDQDRLVRLMRWCGAPDPRVKLTEAEKEKLAAKIKAHPLPGAGEMPVPGFPFDIDTARAAAGAEIFSQKCAACHAWSGSALGKITPVGAVNTDPFRNASFSHELATNFSTMGLEQWWAFSHYRRSPGYANAPLDGTWARAPFLHNGSVPTLADLLNPECKPDDLKQLDLNPTAPDENAVRAEALDPARVADIVAKARSNGKRPPVFFRGDDEYDPARVGFRVDRGTNDDGRRHFLFDTRLRGNSGGGHYYGTELSPDEKSALIEYMKSL